LFLRETSRFFFGLCDFLSEGALTRFSVSFAARHFFCSQPSRFLCLSLTFSLSLAQARFSFLNLVRLFFFDFAQSLDVSTEARHFLCALLRFSFRRSVDGFKLPYLPLLVFGALLRGCFFRTYLFLGR
jgi:hypothetical protein